MKSKNITLLVLFIILIGLGIITIFLAMEEQKISQIDIPKDLLQFDMPVTEDKDAPVTSETAAFPGNVDEILIKRGEEVKLVFENRGGIWFIKEPIDYKANETKLKDLFKKLHEAQIHTNISEDASQHEKFHVSVEERLPDNQKAIHYSFKNKGDIIKEFYVDWEGFKYIRLPDSNTVYALTKGIFGIYDKNVNAWRDKTALDIQPEKLANLKSKYKDNVLNFQKDNGIWKVMVNGEYQESSITEADPTLKAMINIPCDEFPSQEQIDTFTFQNPILTISYQTTDSEEAHTINLYEYPENENRLYCRLKEGDDVVFGFNKYRFNNYEKSADTYLKPPEVSPPSSENTPVLTSPDGQSIDLELPQP